MLNVEELRVGNFVFLNKEGSCRVIKVDTISSNNKICFKGEVAKKDNLFGIPISSNWLEDKFRFDNVNPSLEFKFVGPKIETPEICSENGNCSSFRFIITKEIEEGGDKYFWSPSPYISISLKYIHELQNLYFDLSKTKLVIYE